MLHINYSTETITPETSFYDKPKGLLVVNPDSLVRYTEIICTDKNCRYPHLTLRILNHIFAELDKEKKWAVCPRYVSDSLGANYDTVTKCLKYLRSIDVLRIEKEPLSITC